MSAQTCTYLGGRWGRGGRLGDLDVLHLDGMLGVGLRVMELAHVHCGLLSLVRGGGLEGGKGKYRLMEAKGSLSTGEVQLHQYANRNVGSERSEF